MSSSNRQASQLGREARQPKPAFQVSRGRLTRHSHAASHCTHHHTCTPPCYCISVYSALTLHVVCVACVWRLVGMRSTRGRHQPNWPLRVLCQSAMRALHSPLTSITSHLARLCPRLYSLGNTICCAYYMHTTAERWVDATARLTGSGPSQDTGTHAHQQVYTLPCLRVGSVVAAHMYATSQHQWDGP